MLAADAIDLLALPRAQSLVRVEAPDAFEQALAAQHLVAAGDAAAKVVGDVEEGAVAVGDAAVEREQVALDRAIRLAAAAAALQRSSRSTALRVQTDQWPSRPPRKRTVTAAPSRIAANGVTRSRTMWSSLPV